MWTGLAEAWRSYVQSLEVPPLMLTQEEFLNEVRKINPLVCLEHCRHLGSQLQVRNFDIVDLSNARLAINRAYQFTEFGRVHSLAGKSDSTQSRVVLAGRTELAIESRSERTTGRSDHRGLHLGGFSGAMSLSRRPGSAGFASGQFVRSGMYFASSDD